MRQFLAGSFVLFGLVLVGCTSHVGADKKEKQVAQDEGKERGKVKGDNAQNVPAVKPDFVLTMEAFASEFRADNKAAHAKFGNKIVEITGQMREQITRKQFNMGIPGKGLGIHIACDVLPEYSRKMLHCSSGQKIKVTGKCDPRKADVNVLILQCSLIELESSTDNIVTDAQNLAGDFERDAVAAAAKYEQHAVILSGTLTEAFDDFPRFVATLKGTDKTHVSIRGSDLDFNELTRLKGKSVEFWCVLAADLKKGEIRMEPGILIGEK